MANYEQQRFWLMTTDPVHIGTGGYRLGRVDNSIVREPGTRMPKIPGTSLHGAIRSYAARLYENLDAAGQDQSSIAKPEDDPVCYTFGYLKRSAGSDPDDEAIGYSGVVSIFDAQVLLFPVHSMAGPVWVSTPTLLKAAGFTVAGAPDRWEAVHRAYFTFGRTSPLNVGWLVLDAAARAAVQAPQEWQNRPEWAAVQDRLVLVHDSLLSQIVNSNLEVRTSVSIDPATGAANSGLLFTYEALPRATFLTMDVVLDDYRTASGKQTGAFAKSGAGKTLKDTDLPGGPWLDSLDVVEAGLNMIAWLGVGGMGTRGFGRVKVVAKSTRLEYAGGNQ